MDEYIYRLFYLSRTKCFTKSLIRPRTHTPTLARSFGANGFRVLPRNVIKEQKVLFHKAKAAYVKLLFRLSSTN